MAGFNPSIRKCRNRRNHNCSPCQECGLSEHNIKFGKCIICGDTDLSDYSEWESVDEPIRKNKHKRFDDED